MHFFIFVFLHYPTCCLKKKDPIPQRNNRSFYLSQPVYNRKGFVRMSKSVLVHIKHLACSFLFYFKIKNIFFQLPDILELYPLHCDPPGIGGHIQRLLNNLRLLLIILIERVFSDCSSLFLVNTNFSYAAVHPVLARRPGLEWEVDF